VDRLALPRGGILHSILCAQRVPTHLEDYAKRYTIIRSWAGVTVDLERVALYAGKTKEGGDVAIYAFMEPGTQNPEAFLVVMGAPGAEGAEINRSCWAEITVYRDGVPIVTFPPVTATGLATGYYSG